MNIEEAKLLFLFWSSALSIVLLFISIIILSKNKRFENEKLISGINSMLFGIFLTIISLIILALNFGFRVYPLTFSKYIASIQPSMPIAIQAVELGLFPLIAICLLVGVLYLRENAQE